MERIIIVNRNEFKKIKKRIISNLYVRSTLYFKEGEIVLIKKMFCGLFLYGSIKMKIKEIDKNTYHKGFRNKYKMLILFKAIK